ncbi:GntR family transcriptional regulator [Jannaschia formosa]|uniref:GntR family transcriptional regulator n=1 Tax=Jannaschia formosa TaxID=2259592 RepID=UPI000E1C024F|nr:GntR family transcriptional regulator [Jannaschia formosa]TFL17398.1 GntR family transcriptional regulator [Jannaschia formosa]
MPALDLTPKRRTNADLVFDGVYGQIVSLQLLPGAKISETEIAERYGVSRQPVREAFNRLDGLQLLQIQPQRATQVRRFSRSGIAAARYIRLALELEIARSAIAAWSEEAAAGFDANLDAQADAVGRGDRAAFHALDEAFHARIADVADKRFAFEMVLQKKAQVDRICVLSLKDAAGMRCLVEDHRRISGCLRSGDAAGCDAALRLHLSRIEDTIARIHRDYPDYFED